jgi:uncharacterized membrane protein YhaH (DUF805 family)
MKEALHILSRKRRPPMTKLRYLTLAATTLLIIGGLVLAQNQREPGAPETCAGCGVCGGSMVVIVLIPIAILVLNIALLIWVARDAKSRGMDNAVMWMILVMFTSVLGLVIYLFSRPQGDLVQCPNCKNNRLQASATCPHCGNP